MTIFFPIIIIILGIAVYLVFLATSLVVESFRRDLDYPGEYAYAPRQTVNFFSKDGTQLCGDYYPNSSSNIVLVVAHGRGGNRKIALDFAGSAYKKGYGIFAFDFRGFGDSEGNYSTVAWREQDDLIAAVEWIKSKSKADKVVVLGVSMGAAAAIQAAAGCLLIDGIIADSPFANLEETIYLHASYARIPSLFVRLALLGVHLRFGLNCRSIAPEDQVHLLAPRPILFIHSTDDRLAPVTHSQRLFDRAGEPKTFWMVSNCHHSKACYEFPDQYNNQVNSFLESILL